MTRAILPAVLVLSMTACSLRSSQDSFFQEQDVRVFFSNPGAGIHTQIKKQIITQIDHAQSSIDIAVYELKNWEVIQSLVNAHKRGIDLRFVGDINNLGNEGYQVLIDAGIPYRLGNAERSMHHKYLIVDKQIVVTGSANFTDTAFYCNLENVLLIRNRAVAAFYQEDFDLMFDRGLFGIQKSGVPEHDPSAHHFKVTNNGVESILSVYFAPHEAAYSPQRVDHVLIDMLESLEEEICFSVFAFSHPDIAQAMIRAAAGGLKVRGIFDATWHLNSEYSVHDYFIQAQGWYPGLEVRFDGNDNHVPGNPLSGAKCHNKYIIGDRGRSNAFVLAGSYNFSKSSSYSGNDENFIIIRDSGIIREYYRDFLEQWRAAYSITRGQGGDEAAYQEVLISEVMWAGSRDDQKRDLPWDDFIELYNPGYKSINLSGWQLEGTRATQSRSILRFMTILPKGTILSPGQVLLLSASRNHAWSYTNTVVDEALFLYEKESQESLRIVLKDCNGTLIDEAGLEGHPPFAGDAPVTGILASMERQWAPAGPGRISTAWKDSSGDKRFIRPSYQKYTRATPGIIPGVK